MDLQDYVQRVLLSVYPDALPEGHPGALRVRIAQSPVPNAMALSDGTIVVNVGLLTLLRSEDELAAVLAHEVGHVVLDHNMERYLAAKSRAGMATFLGAVAGVTAGVLSAGSSDPSIRYAAGEIAVGAFVLGTALSAGALEL
ncbi:MAG: M48 family metalloprotease, partial [bacterium]